MPKRVKSTVDEAAQMRLSGVRGAGAKWESNASGQRATQRYTGSFGPVLAAQNQCSDEVLRSGAQGFAALAAYGGCMSGRGRSAIAGGGA